MGPNQDLLEVHSSDLVAPSPFTTSGYESHLLASPPNRGVRLFEQSGIGGRSRDRTYDRWSCKCVGEVVPDGPVAGV